MIKNQLERYARLLVDEQCVKSGRITICGQNDSITCHGADEFSALAEHLLKRIDCTAIIIAEPLHPFPFFLVKRSSPDCTVIVPGDSESKSSLHDIPIIRSTPNPEELLNLICTALQKRKGCIVEGIGMISQGALTAEQAYITWSSLMHATCIKYLQDLLATGPFISDEIDAVRSFRDNLKALPFLELTSDPPSSSPVEIISTISRAGKITVEMGLVDSFFGNISWTTDDVLYISQTSARMDELTTQIDPVPFNASTTTGLTASSELPAHKAIIKKTGSKAIVHGHPKFPVIMSFFCAPDADEGGDDIDGIPVVQGEGGMGGLAESLPEAFHKTGANAVIVQGHGVFAISRNSFNEALSALASVERRCRELYFLRLKENGLSW